MFCFTMRKVLELFQVQSVILRICNNVFKCARLIIQMLEDRPKKAKDFKSDL